jgi:hypothetical protein
MELAEDNAWLEQLDAFLSRRNQTWLLGAGASYEANLPLMGALTEIVLERVKDSDLEPLIQGLRSDIADDAHIEHLLSHLGDHFTLAERKKSEKATICGKEYGLSELQDAHRTILKHITETILLGCQKRGKGEPWEVGDQGKSIVDVTPHRKFVSALLNTRRAGVEGRRPAVRLFTTNYDTLIEDGLAWERFRYWDGFSGGAVAYRDHRFGSKEPEITERYDALVSKLHGSIDWHLDGNGSIYRIRRNDPTPGDERHVMIYPQATKYIATQRDPFAAQFEMFRRSLNETNGCVLCICGYSFGDEHINDEIELALSSSGNDTTILAFVFEGDLGLPQILTKWRSCEWGRRLFIMTENGLYLGNKGPLCQPEKGESLNWWTFSGLTEFLENGPGALVK